MHWNNINAQVIINAQNNRTQTKIVDDNTISYIAKDSTSYNIK